MELKKEITKEKEVDKTLLLETIEKCKYLNIT